MKLDIGSGRKPHKGYTTIDVEAYANPIYLGDFREMEFADIDEIRSHHLLEHFSRLDSIRVLTQWCGWLKPGGTLIVETPDFEYICKDFDQKANREWLARHTFGSQESGWAYHRDGWWEDKFRAVLPKVGFKIVDIRRNKSRVFLPNILVVAEKAHGI